MFDKRDVQEGYQNLLNRYKDHIEGRIDEAQKLKKSLEEGKAPNEVYLKIVEIWLTNSYWRNWITDMIKDCLKEMDHHISREKYVMDMIHNSEYLREGLSLDEFRDKFWETLKKQKKFKSIRNFKKKEKYDEISTWLKESDDMKDIRGWLEKGHKSIIGEGDREKALNEVFGKGQKGKNLLLRDVGYFDCVPIDTHERRFVIRTGIFHIYKPETGETHDPFDDEHIQKSIVQFCKNYLYMMLNF